MNSLHLRLAARILRSGGLIAYASEAVWGLGCLPEHEPALRRLLKLKRRPAHKGLIVVAAALEQVRPLLLPLPPEVLSTIGQTWPGPHTWLLPVKPSVTRLLRGRHDTLAVRVTAHPVLSTLCGQVGPIVSTSANRAGRPPARTSLALRRAVGAGRSAGVDYVLPGATGGLARPTPIRDARSGIIVRRA